jgi:hypothetical protein
MRRKVIRTNNTTITILVGVIVLMGVYIMTKNKSENTIQVIREQSPQIIVSNMEDPTDSLRNVYAPPVRYNDIDFRQLGYLTSSNASGRLPLFGRPLNRRDKWVYYTMDGGIKLPISIGRRDCTQTPGCDSLSDRDQVTIEGVTFDVHLYDNKLISY